MSRLGPVFEACRKDDRAALIGYLPTGYPDVPTSVAGMVALVESGCDIVEVGVPYSDPGMDGPTIAKATEVALRGGVRVRDTLAAVEAISAGRWQRRRDDVLESGAALRGRRVRAGPGSGRRIRSDHSGPHSRRSAAVAGGIRGAPVGSHIPGGAVVDSAAVGDHGRSIARVRLRGVDDGCHRGARCGVECRPRVGGQGEGGVRHTRRRGSRRAVAGAGGSRSAVTPTVSSSARRWCRRSVTDSPLCAR